MKEGGARGYTGKTQYGKTTLALRHQKLDCDRHKIPGAILDLGAVSSFIEYPHAANVREVLECLIVRRVHARPWTPESESARKLFWRKMREWGGAAIFADEIWNICSPNYVDEDFVTLSNQWAHGKLGPVFLYYTTQRVIYVNEKLYPAIKHWFIFNSTKGAEMDKLRRMWDVNPAEIAALPVGGFKYVCETAQPLGPEYIGHQAPQAPRPSAGELPVSGAAARGSGRETGGQGAESDGPT